VAALSQDQHIFELLLSKMKPVVSLDPDLLRNEIIRKVRMVHYNKIVTVPKTALVDRTIAIEPLLNGYLQSGVDVFMRRRLRRVGIDLTDQSRNQRLAMLGSYDHSDPYITIDLSSASDLISKNLVRALLPPAWYAFLDAIRSPAYQLDDGVAKRYHKFVSMGNGFCFPLETLIFASVCQLYSKTSTDFTVYGDDIIVRQSISAKVLKTLWQIGFRHNPEKTFLKGPFRESCGADWFAGRDVRPLTLDYEINSLNSVIKFFNLSMGKPSWASKFRSVREYLWNLIPSEYRLCRPYSGVVFGAFEVFMDEFQASPFSRWDPLAQAWKWWELDLVGVRDNGFRKDERYYTALMMAAVRGSPSRLPFARRRKTSLSVRQKSYAGASSNWLPPLSQ